MRLPPPEIQKQPLRPGRSHIHLNMEDSAPTRVCWDFVLPYGFRMDGRHPAGGGGRRRGRTAAASLTLAGLLFLMTSWHCFLQ